MKIAVLLLKYIDSLHSKFSGNIFVKNLKLKIRPEDEHKYNSPWNIAADFKIDMSFSKEEIAEMLKEYEHDAWISH